MSKGKEKVCRGKDMLDSCLMIDFFSSTTYKDCLLQQKKQAEKEDVLLARVVECCLHDHEKKMFYQFSYPREQFLKFC